MTAIGEGAEPTERMGDSRAGEEFLNLVGDDEGGLDPMEPGAEGGRCSWAIAGWSELLPDILSFLIEAIAVPVAPIAVESVLAKPGGLLCVYAG